MPKRIVRLARRNPILTNLIIVMIVFSVGFWRVEHLYQCAQDYAEATTEANRPVREAAAQLEEADNAGWAAIDRVLSGQGDEADIDQLRRAAHHRRQLADELAKTRKENPVPEPPGTFC